MSILQYPDLYSLMAEVPEARQYFDMLPDYVRDQISTRPQGVNNFESLQSYAEKLLASDD